jgi:hypothetical protein
LISNLALILGAAARVAIIIVGTYMGRKQK